jgi:hypothetical protein
MKRLLFLCSLAVFIPSVYGGTCRPVYNIRKNWGGLPPTWGSYKRYNRCCLNEDFYVDLQFGAYQLNMPPFSYGELLDANAFGIEPLPQFSLRRDKVNGCYPKIALGVEMDNGWCPCWVGSTIFFEVGASYVERDKFSELGNGTFGPFALPTLDGSGDLVFPTVAGESLFSGVDFKRNYRYGNVAIKLGSSFLFPTNCQSALIPFIETDFSYLHQAYTMNIGSISGAATASRFFLKETLNTQYFDYGIGLDLYRALRPRCRTPFVFGEVAFFGSCAKTTFEGEQRVTLNVLPADRANFLEKHLDRLTYKIRGQAGFGYQFGYNFSAALMGQVDYWGYVPVIVNPQRLRSASTTTLIGIYDKPAHIEATSALNYAIVLNLNFVFF